MKREREKHITRLHIILFFLAVIITIIVIVSIKGCQANSDKKYVELEDEMVVASKTYIKRNNVQIVDGHSIKINLKILRQGSYIQNELADECDGYVLIESQKGYDGTYEVTYNAYISCGGSYISPGYSDVD